METKEFKCTKGDLVLTFGELSGLLKVGSWVTDCRLKIRSLQRS